MSIRKILVPVSGGESGARALEVAFALAATMGAHVLGLHVRVEPADAVPFVGEGMSGALVQELMELTERESAARAVAARTLFQRAQQAAGVPSVEVPGGSMPSAAWEERAGREGDAIVRSGRLSDLIVVERPSPDAAAWEQATLGMVLFETGRPVYVAGAESQRGAPSRIAIAWNRSAEAARSVAAALPLLARATQVTSITVDNAGEGRRNLADLAAYLAWHGIAADPRVIAARGSVGEALADAAADAELLVMGGYTHSRLRELFLGGVTRYMLERARLPLLIAH
jgi:nucleotide-binding universal stress UspA family protein